MVKLCRRWCCRLVWLVEWVPLPRYGSASDQPARQLVSIVGDRLDVGSGVGVGGGVDVSLGSVMPRLLGGALAADLVGGGVGGLFGAGWHYEYLGFGGLCCDCVDHWFVGVGVVGECCGLVFSVADLFGGFC